MIRLAWKNLIQDKMRLAVTMMGIIFAVALMMVQSGIYFGFSSNVSGRIDNCPADVWIMVEGAFNADTARPFPQEVAQRIQAIPGIEWAEKLTRGFAFLRMADGGSSWAIVFGFDPDSGIGGPKEMVRGSILDLRKPDSFIVDESTLALLKGASIGDKLENFDKKMEIVGICRGHKSPNTYPVLFASNKTMQKHSVRMDNSVVYVVAKFQEGANQEQVMERLNAIRHFDVYRSKDFSSMVKTYWTNKTGVGMGIAITMTLAFIVGLVIVGQTMYSATVERIREYATLKALGASNWAICRAIWAQAIFVGLAGYFIGMALSTTMMLGFASKVLSIKLTPMVFLVVLVTTLVMCLGAALLSIFRVLKVDPATVFRS